MRLAYRWRRHGGKGLFALGGSQPTAKYRNADHGGHRVRKGKQAGPLVQRPGGQARVLSAGSAGNLVIKQNPDFDPRTYGYTKFNAV